MELTTEVIVIVKALAASATFSSLSEGQTQFVATDRQIHILLGEEIAATSSKMATKMKVDCDFHLRSCSLCK